MIMPRHRTLIEEDIEAFARGFDGRISLMARDLSAGRTIAYHADRKCPTASVIKLPILIHALLLEREGALFLDETVIVSEEDKKPGSGILTQLSTGHKLSLADACTLMIALSDNTATNLVIDRVGLDAINERMRSLGLTETMLHRKVFSSGPPVSAPNARYGLGVSTPREIVRLLTMLNSNEIGEATTCKKARGILAKQQYRDAIPRYLPHSYKFEGKSGATDYVRNDAGIVTTDQGRQIALAIFINEMPTALWTADNPGQLAIAQLAKMVVQHFVQEGGS
jgi:beta-lactamase class A